MNLQPHQQRVVDEKQELDGRRDKLEVFIVSDLFQTLDSAEQERMLRQAKAMGEYSLILGERIQAWG
jgi:stress-induced morphogen